MNMNTIIKSKVLLFLIALAIPTIVFIIMAYMMSILLKGNVVLSPFICIALVTYFLIVCAELINEDAAGSIGTAFGIGLGTAVPLFLLFLCSEKYDFKVKLEWNDMIAILFIYGWTLSVFRWTCNLFKKQKDIINTNNINNATNDNDDLIGGWYGVDSNLSCWLPVLAFEKNYIATFSDGKIVKEYSYHICCSTCIILTAKDGEKIFVKRIWVKGKPHLFYNEQAFTQDGKHSE